MELLPTPNASILSTVRLSLLDSRASQYDNTASIWLPLTILEFYVIFLSLLRKNQDKFDFK